jgi:hypothetical protein
MFSAATANAANSESNSTAIKVTAADGKDVTLTINGNICADQISELWYATNEALYNSTDIAFMLKSQNSTIQFMNMTVAKSDVLGGTAPIVTIDGVYSKNSGFSQDSTNYYVWFTALSDSGQIDRSKVQITFLLTPKLTAIGPSLSILYTVGIVVAAVLVAALSLLLIIYKRCYDKTKFLS